jgi:hypothetical protein
MRLAAYRDADPDWAILSLQLERSIDRLASRPVDRLHGLMAGTAAAALLRCWVERPRGHLLAEPGDRNPASGRPSHRARAPAAPDVLVHLGPVNERPGGFG